MNRVLFLVAFIFLSFIVYTDLSNGTYPVSKMQRPDTAPSQQENATQELHVYKELQVQEGDTLISLIQRANDKPLQDLDQAVKDFKELNNNIEPRAIQPGKTYKIPVYK